MKVITVYPNFANLGGAQNVALQLAQALNENSLPVVLTSTPPGTHRFGLLAQGGLRKFFVTEYSALCGAR